MLAVASNPQVSLSGGNNNRYVSRTFSERVAEFRCLHKYLIHASDYDPRVYEAFLSILANHLQVLGLLVCCFA